VRYSADTEYRMDNRYIPRVGIWSRQSKNSMYSFRNIIQRNVKFATSSSPGGRTMGCLITLPHFCCSWDVSSSWPLQTPGRLLYTVGKYCYYC